MIYILMEFSVPVYRMPSILRRYRRDQRQLDVDEELWFNEEDDFDDVPAGKLTAPDLDNSLGKTFGLLI